jgi:hypothetical protein
VRWGVKLSCSQTIRRFGEVNEIISKDFQKIYQLRIVCCFRIRALWRLAKYSIPMKKTQERIDYHKAGTIRGRGTVTEDGGLHGYWEWFRKDGTKMRSGYFDGGDQVGEWVTYDQHGKPYKTTHFKTKA